MDLRMTFEFLGARQLNLLETRKWETHITSAYDD